MNSNTITSLLLFIAVVALTIVLGGREINSKIEETIKANYETEILALKNKLAEQGELINSIIKLGDSNLEDNGDEDAPGNDISADQENISNDFDYTKENGGITIKRYKGRQTDVEIPSVIDGLPVLKIGENAFSETAVKNVYLPSTCMSIDWFSFYGCYALKSIHIPSSVNSIGYGAFDSCSKGLTLYCYKDSYAETFAQSFGYSFSYIK